MSEHSAWKEAFDRVSDQSALVGELIKQAKPGIDDVPGGRLHDEIKKLVALTEALAAIGKSPGSDSK
jgi:hypothetical protein